MEYLKQNKRTKTKRNIYFNGTKHRVTYYNGSELKIIMYSALFFQFGRTQTQLQCCDVNDYADYQAKNKNKKQLELNLVWFGCWMKSYCDL